VILQGVMPAATTRDDEVMGWSALVGVGALGLHHPAMVPPPTPPPPPTTHTTA
jgi:hypothetical protein